MAPMPRTHCRLCGQRAMACTEQIDELHVAGGVVCATSTYHGTFRATGRSLSAESCHLWTVRDGVVHRFRQYTDTAAFAEAMQ